MLSAFTTRRESERGFSILEMMFATIILLVGLVAIAQLVPASILLNYRNRMDSSALVFAQRQLDQMLDQPMNPPSNQFTDALGNICQLGNPAVTNAVQGTNVLLFNNRSEEHTSELQSHLNLVCRLLLEKKKKLECYCVT